VSRVIAGLSCGCREVVEGQTGGKSGLQLWRARKSRPRRGNAPGNTRGLRHAISESESSGATTESATENRPPVMLGPRRQACGKTASSPRLVKSFGKGEKVG
jgi:hypothetical protein